MTPHACRAGLFRLLDALCIPTETVEHPPLFTVADSKKLRGEIPGAHTKNLFLKSKKGELFLLVAQESATIALGSLHKDIGSARLSFGPPELLFELLGVRPGSVSPFALLNDRECRVRLILDAALLQAERLNFHPLENTATTGIAPADFLRFLASTGHKPHLLALKAETGVESDAPG